MLHHERLPHGRRPKGFTLVELILGMAITSITLVMALSGYNLLLGRLEGHRRVASAQQDLQEVFIMLEHDLRSAGADPLSVGLFKTTTPMLEVLPVGHPQAGGLRLRADLTGPGGLPDGDLDDPDEVVTWALDPSTSTLFRWSNNGSGGTIAQPLARGVESFTWTPIDASGADTTPDAATGVRCRLEMTVSTGESAAGMTRRRVGFTADLTNRLYGNAGY